MKLAGVTAFYDVGRAGYDGRTASEYVDWLNKTLQVPLPFVIFLDPSFDASGVVLKPGDRIVRVARDELTMFGHRARVEEILATSRSVNRRDISFRLADYSMLVMSKPEFLKRAARETDADFLVWIDAGISRFLPDLSRAGLSVRPQDLDGLTIGVNTSYHLRQRIRIGRFPKKLVGRAQAMMSAMDFIVAHDFAEEFSSRIDFLVETDWLPDGRWDNEQVAIGCLLFRGGLPNAKVLHTDLGPFAATTRWLFGAPYLKRPVPLHVWWKLLRDEVRTRRTPKSECYLPEDFPESGYLDWVRENR